MTGRRATLAHRARPHVLSVALAGLVAACSPSDPPPPPAGPPGASYLTPDGRIVVVCAGDAPSPPPGELMQRGRCLEVDGRRTIVPPR